jgi:hypothetical protein
MSKIAAWIVIAVGAALVYSLAFTTFTFQVGYESTGEGGYVELTIECPPPATALLLRAVPENSADPGVCVPPSRTLSLEAGIVALAATIAAWTPLRRPRPEPIGPMSEKINPAGDPPRG